MNFKAYLAMLGVASVLSMPLVASAQDANAPDEDASSKRVFEEVVVTARKRDETLQDIPVTVSALSQQQIKDFRIERITDLSAQIPGFVAIDTTDAAPQGTLALRGVKTGAVGVGADQTVSINIDGVQVENPFALRAGQLDLQQVEILKGPQALFFGKNVTGGVVSLKSADPTDELFVAATVGHEFNAEETFGEVIVSGPLSDTLGARLALRTVSLEGWVENRATRPVVTRSSPNYDEILGRLTLAWDPSDVFSANLKVSYADRDGLATNNSEKVDCANPAFTPSDCTSDFVNFIADAPGYDPADDSESTIFSLNMDWAISENLSLSSTTGYYNITDLTQGQQFVIDTELTGDVAANIATEFESFSQELRLTSNFDGPFNFMVGAFIDDRSGEQDQSDFNFGIIGPVPATFQALDAESYSVFVQGSYQITEELELSAGVRYTDEEKSYTGEFTQDFLVPTPMGLVPVVTAGTPIIPSTSDIQADETTPEITLTWQPEGRDLTVFAAYKEGFKSGSFDLSAPNAFLAFAPPGVGVLDYDPETAQGFEIGVKSYLLDGSLRLNATAYSYEYENLQVASIDLVSGFIGTINASASEVEGFEADIVWKPQNVDGLTITGAINHNNANYSDDFFALCNTVQVSTGTCPFDLDPDPMSGPTFQNLNGESLSQAPDWAGNLGFTYENSFNDKLGYRFGLNWVYSDSFIGHPNNDPRAVTDSFSMLHGNFNLYNDDSGWEIALIGRNLTDENVVFSYNDQVLSAPPGQLVDLNGPAARAREIVLQFSKNW